MIDPWDCWAKAPKEKPGEWHALPWHLLEVGAVAEAMWSGFLPESIKGRLRECWQMTDEEARRWIGFLAAVHDIGKASPRFQSMSLLQFERLQSIYGPGLKRDKSDEALRHSLISLGLLELLFQEEFGWHYRIAGRYAEITAAHHGRFWSIDNISSLEGGQARKRMGVPGWADTHRLIFTELAQAFAIDSSMTNRLDADGNDAPGYPTYELSLWLTGLISIADWIGSDERHFPLRDDKPASFSAGLSDARSGAKAALIHTGWASPPLEIPSSSMQVSILTILDFVPTSAQRSAERFMREMILPGLTVIEIPMGWGKTEIALWIAAYYAERFGVPGLYFALPTMATSDQMFDRVHRHLLAHAKDQDRRRIVPLQLLHGMADLSTMDEVPTDDPFTGLADSVSKLDDPDRNLKEVQDQHNVVRRARWFNPKKRGLLARYGVGTVDQALMSVLNTPHFFVRMFGLAGKTVVFDEAHAYDFYMGTLFERLIRFLGALGSPVVVLSATLPKHRTQQLMAAYAEGAGWDPTPAEVAAYPRISAVDSEAIRSITVEPEETQKSLTIALEWFPGAPDSMWPSLAERLKWELRDDGNVAIICNTVAAAQACYKEFEKHFPPEELTLFHARFRRKERGAIQGLTLDRFGKTAGEDGNPERPKKHIVIATQVIEQSLDLDFDLMVSMFCPTDLLLQRVGRLQRHRKWDSRRPKSFLEPRLWLIGFDTSDDDKAPVFDAYSAKIYFEYFLLRSWIALSGRSTIAIPQDVERLIEGTYGEHGAIPEHFVSRLSDLEQVWREDTQMDAAMARDVLIHDLSAERKDSGTDVLVELSETREDPELSPDAHKSRLALTRLGDPTVSLVVLTQDDVRELGRNPSTDDVDELSLHETRWLLERSVSISSGAIVHSATVLQTPRSWEKSAHLGFHKLVVLDENNEKAFENGNLLRWSPELGIVITKEGDA